MYRTRKLEQSFARREFDQTFLSALPDGADPCGERGEFHSFVYAGPMLNAALSVSVGVTVVRDYFALTQLSAQFLGDVGRIQLWTRRLGLRRREVSLHKK